MRRFPFSASITDISVCWATCGVIVTAISAVAALRFLALSSVGASGREGRWGTGAVISVGVETETPHASEMERGRGGGEELMPVLPDQYARFKGFEVRYC